MIQASTTTIVIVNSAMKKIALNGHGKRTATMGEMFDHVSTPGELDAQVSLFIAKLQDEIKRLKSEVKILEGDISRYENVQDDYLDEMNRVKNLARYLHLF